MKLKDLLDLNEIRYSDEIKPKHQEKMNMPTELIADEMVVPEKPFPENSSMKTRNELQWLCDYNGGVIDKSFVDGGDDISIVFEKYCEENNLEYNKKYYKQIIKESAKTILSLKYYYNRPRPKQVADYLEMDLPTTTLESMHTPSYPSGHSIQGIFIAKVLSKMYPKHKKQLMEIGKMVSNSRLMARAHYPSDTKLGEKIGELLFLNLK